MRVFHVTTQARSWRRRVGSGGPAARAPQAADTPPLRRPRSSISPQHLGWGEALGRSWLIALAEGNRSGLRLLLVCRSSEINAPRRSRGATPLLRYPHRPPSNAPTPAAELGLRAGERRVMPRHATRRAREIATWSRIRPADSQAGRRADRIRSLSSRPTAPRQGSDGSAGALRSSGVCTRARVSAACVRVRVSDTQDHEHTHQWCVQ